MIKKLAIRSLRKPMSLKLKTAARWVNCVLPIKLIAVLAKWRRQKHPLMLLIHQEVNPL